MSRKLLECMGRAELHPKPILRPADVSEVLDIPVATVWRLLEKNKLPGMKMGGAWLVTRSALIDYLNGLAASCSVGGQSLADLASRRLAKSRKQQQRVFGR
jgi:excisionase family DNA binding protein